MMTTTPHSLLRVMYTAMLVFAVLTNAPAQEIDTLQVKRLVELQAALDSLRQQMRSLDSELQNVKSQVAEGSDLDKILAAFNEESVESVPEDQRSRRKRVDALLKIISEQPGQLRFNGDATAILQGDTGADRFSTGVGSFDIFAHTSFGRNTLLFFDFEAIGGNGPNEFIDSLTPLNNDAGSTQNESGIDQLTVLEAWAEFTILKEAFTITAGKIDLTNYFDNNASANDETSQFISAAFVNSAALPVPGNSPGMRVRTTLLRKFYLQLGLASEDNSGNKLFDDLFRIASMGFRVFPDTDWEANLRLYLYEHPAVPNNAGYGLSYDEAIFGAFTAFGRYNQNDQKLAQWFDIRSAWSAGARFVRMIARRRMAIGAAYAETKPFAAELKIEKLSEVYLRHHFNKWIHASLHLQLLWNAAGKSENHTVLGFRTHFNF